MSDRLPSLRTCRVEVVSNNGMVRVFQLKVPSSVNTTPSSVLQTAAALAGSDSSATGFPEDILMESL